MAALSCSLSLDVEGQTDWWKPHLLLFFEFQCSSHSWVMRLGGSKCWFLPFLYFSSFVVFILQSLRSCRKVLYHRSQKLHLLLRFSPLPNASLPLERTTKVSPSFLAYFVENTVLHWYWFWNGSWCGWFLICLSVLCPRRWPLHALQEHSSQLRKVSRQAPAYSFTRGLSGLRKLPQMLLLWTIKIFFFTSLEWPWSSKAHSREGSWRCGTCL